MLLPSRRREPPEPRRGGEEERCVRKEVWREGERERERKSFEEKSVEVAGTRVSRRREDLVERWERCWRMVVERGESGLVMVG